MSGIFNVIFPLKPRTVARDVKHTRLVSSCPLPLPLTNVSKASILKKNTGHGRPHRLRGLTGLSAIMLIIINISDTVVVVNDKESHHYEPPGHQLTSDRKFYGQN